ncbi:copper chaperone PCu(A)C [Labrys okinawensis]|uniref:copper chaperone PCu(A)C n=1 Tax=Labrys okinawensis TaxID=346911 RepID=UPI0039BCA1C2
MALLSIVASTTPFPQASAQETGSGSLVIQHPWARATPPGAPVGGGYVTIANKGATADKLVGGTVDVAASVEIHQMTTEDGVMKMRQLDGLEVPAGGEVTFSPDGLHLMFVGLKHGLKKGQHIEGTLVFEKAGTVKVEYEVEGIGAKASSSGQSMPGMNMN